MKQLSATVKTMSSREMAKLTDKSHDNVLKLIRGLIDSGVVKNTIPQEYVHRQNKQTYIEYVCDKRDSLVIVARLSAEFTAAVVDRWQELEAKEQSESARLHHRQVARLEAPLMTKALQDARTRQGKESPPHVFSNDFNMIYRIVLGAMAKEFKKENGFDDDANIRDCLTLGQIKAVESLQRLNQALHELDVVFEARKEKLNHVFMRDHAPAMIEEVLKLNA